MIYGRRPVLTRTSLTHKQFKAQARTSYSYHDTLAILAEVKTEFKNVNFQVKRLLNLAVCVAPHGFCGLAAFGIDLYLWGLSTHIDFV